MTVCTMFFCMVYQMPLLPFQNTVKSQRQSIQLSRRTLLLTEVDDRISPCHHHVICPYVSRKRGLLVLIAFAQRRRVGSVGSSDDVGIGRTGGLARLNLRDLYYVSS